MEDKTELTAARVATGSIYLVLQNVFSNLIGILGFAFMARRITQAEMGAIAGFNLLASLVQFISDFGLNSSIAKHVSESRGKGQDFSEIVTSAVSFRAVICLVPAAILFAMAPNISVTVFGTDTYTFTIRLLSLDAVILSISPLLNGILLGIGRLKEIAIFGIASVSVIWLSVTAFLLADKGTDGIVLGWIIGDGALLIMLALVVARFAEFRKRLSNSAKQIPSLLKFALPLYLASAVSFLHAWYDKAIVLAYLPLSDLAVYNTASMAFSVLVTIATALGSALIPYYGMAHGRNDQRAIRLGIKRVSKYTILAMFPLTLGLMATSKPTLALFAGQQYETGWAVLATLSIFGLTYGITPALSNLLLIYGKTKTILVLSLTSTILSLTLLPLIGILGLEGLAIIRGASLALSLALTAYFINKTVKVQIDKGALAKALTASATMATIILILEQISYNKYLLPLYVLIGATIYITLIRTLKVLNQEDFQFLKQTIGERAAKYIMRILT